MMAYQVVGYPLCPFVQRVLITLNLKGIDYELKWLNPHAELPDWFKEWSPTGRVPVMKEPSGTILFESMAIVEFIEESHPTPSIYQKESAMRALNRAWAGIAGELYGPQYLSMRAESSEAAHPYYEQLATTLALLEEQAVKGQFFHGAALSVTDIVLAPMFARFNLMMELGSDNFYHNMPKLKSLSERLLAEEAVYKTMSGEWKQQFIDNMKQNGGYLFH